MRDRVVRALFGVTALIAFPVGMVCAGGPNLEVVSHSPTRNALTVVPTAPIDVVFDRAVSPASFTATPFRFHAFGERSGPIAGSFTFLDGNTRARFTPASPFMRGERVWVTMSHDLAGADAALLRPQGYTWQFWVTARSATLGFTLVDILDTTEPGVSPRPYGGQACDFNNDGAVDLCIVNEDTSDLRLFLNNPANPGGFAPFIQPTAGTGPVPSPNEAADFNGDGLTDMCTANTSGTTFSILLGNGDGTFQPAVDYPCGSGPHGIAVLDADGDGDIDVATANTTGNNVTLSRNNGAGVFGPPTIVAEGGDGEWALNAADMTNDGIADLVVGARGSGDITLHLGNGNGTFFSGGGLETGLQYWMIVCADVNGDGNLDVTAAASFSGGVIHLGDGGGSLDLPQIFPTIGMVATDTGDLDGDGDLDWVLSSFQNQHWYLLLNSGGVFTPTQAFPATSNPACSLILDFNKDGTLDLVMIDEISDEVMLYRNSPPPGCIGDADSDGDRDFADITSILSNWGASGPPFRLGDADGTGTVDFSDVTSVLANFNLPCV